MPSQTVERWLEDVEAHRLRQAGRIGIDYAALAEPPEEEQSVSKKSGKRMAEEDMMVASKRRRQNDGDSGFDSIESAAHSGIYEGRGPLVMDQSLEKTLAWVEPRTNTSPSRSSSPSKSRAPSRSSSPSKSGTSSPSKGGSRQKRVALEFASPQVLLGPFKTDIAKHQVVPPVPDGVTNTIRALMEPSGQYVPVELKDWVEQRSPRIEQVDGHVLETDVRTDMTRISDRIYKIYKGAYGLYVRHADENAWYTVVRDVLSVLAPSEDSLLSVEESQGKTVCTELLPLEGGKRTPIASVKTDFVIQMNQENVEVASVLRPIFVDDANISLSAFNDPTSAKTMVAALVEVKTPAGDMAEGVYQFSVASAATLARLRGLVQRGTANGLRLPVVGWVVHGHSWFLHAAYHEEDGSVVSPCISALRLLY